MKPNTDDKFFETKYWRIVLSIDQRYLGRCVVVLKRRCSTLAELKKEEWLDFAELVKRLESTLKRAFGATMFNWTCLMNDAYQKSPPNPQVHWHFRPRYNHKVKFAGLTLEDPEFGHHYGRTRKHEVSDKVRKRIVEKIKESWKL